MERKRIPINSVVVNQSLISSRQISIDYRTGIMYINSLGGGSSGVAAYDRTIAVGDVNPKHLSVYFHMVIGVDYD